MIQSYNYFYILGSLFAAFIICFTAIPSIVFISKVKHLFADENSRSSHTEPTPSLGGLAIFIAFNACTLLFTVGEVSSVVQFTLVAVTLMFAIGLKDDILIISPTKKFLIQFIAAFIIVVYGDIRITDFNGLLWIHSLGYWFSIFFSAFLFVLITNALNLIDGIDGLSSSLTIIICLFFGSCFFLMGRMDLVILASVLVGSLAAFFYYNVYSRRTKIFMGDTGSLILGTVIAVFTIEFNEINITSSSVYAFSNAPVVVIGVLIIPLFDTFRLFITRIINGRSPFSADKNHIHHMLLSLGCSHRRASLCLSIVDLSFLCLIIYLRNININLLLCIILVVASLGSYVLALASGHYTSRIFKNFHRPRN